MASHGTPDALRVLGMAPYNFQASAIQGILDHAAEEVALCHPLTRNKGRALPFLAQEDATKEKLDGKPD
jgi:hypothetical protein